MAQGAVMNTAERTVLPFPCVPSFAGRRALRKTLINILRLSESPVIVDLSGCSTLNQEDINLLLDCLALRAGRDTQLLFVATSPVIQTLLDVTRISSLVPVLDSLETALCYPQAAVNYVEKLSISPSEPSSFLTGVHK
jgi:hypothetical protein